MLAVLSLLPLLAQGFGWQHCWELLLCLNVSKTATPVQDSNPSHLHLAPVCLFVVVCHCHHQVYIIHRFDYLEASKVMQRRVLNNPKIEVGGGV